jgi:WD40-like Beta Propeller Repeat
MPFLGRSAMRGEGRRALASAIALVGAVAAPSARADLVPLPASAPTAATSIFSQATTTLLSRSLRGGVPNGPSSNAVVSRDDRLARLIAYQSDASDIVAGDTNGTTDVFAVHRAEPYSSDGSPWRIGSTALVSHGIGGQAANGPSYGPAVGGDLTHAPNCVAFVSQASNLVPGDTNGLADAFLWRADTGVITRVSVGSHGEQANGPTYDVSVSGDCMRVAFSSSATNLALRRTRKLAWRSAVSAQPSGTQVYVRFIGGGHDRSFRGLTMLASVSSSGRPGSGDSSEPSLSASGKSLAFTSTATNLARGDSGAGPDVYVRSLERRFKHFGRGRAAQVITRGTRLVSATASGAAGNGASSHPSVSDNGRYVAYQTLSSDLVPHDGNGVSDIVLADLSSSRPSQTAISATPAGLGNGASTEPSISSSAHFIAFQSDASNLRMRPNLLGDTNGVCDMMVGVVGLAAASVESLNNQNRFVTSPSGRPSISSHGNYIAFESADSLMDTNHPNPGVRAIYLRYLGPKNG